MIITVANYLIKFSDKKKKTVLATLLDSFELFNATSCWLYFEYHFVNKMKETFFLIAVIHILVGISQS